MKHTAAYIACLAAVLCANVHSATVRNTNNMIDPRYMTTGCRYENAFGQGGSIGIWIKNIKAYATPAALFGCRHVNYGSWKNDQGIILLINNNGDFVFRVSGMKDGSVATVDVTASGSSSLLNDGKWHFVLGTFEVSATGTARLYIDGTEAASSSSPLDSLVPSRCLAMACVGSTEESQDRQNSGYAAGFEGYVAEATVWNVALGTDRISALYTRRARPWEDNLIGYWPLAKNNQNIAQNAYMRADGSRPGALFYYSLSEEDGDFFENAPALFVVPPSWVAENSYEMPEGATFKTMSDPATNIQAAVAAASADDVIYLLPGTYPLDDLVDITKANLTITGKYAGEIVGEVVLDGQSRTRHFRSHKDYSGQSGFVFDALTLVNGSISSSGGSMAFNSRTGIVRNCVFRNNTATSSGGAVYSYTANGTVFSNCTFVGNSSQTYGGAAYTQQNSISPYDRCFFVDCTFLTNSAEKVGGGIHAERCVEVDTCRFDGNVAKERGGNIRIGTYSKVRNSGFSGASSSQYGGCMEIGGENGSSDASLSNCLFTGLSQSSGYGRIHINALSGLLLANCVFTNIIGSSAIFYPEGARFTARQCLLSSSGVVLVDHRSMSRFENCTVLNGSFDGKSVGYGTNVLVNCVLPNADISSSGSYANILTNCCVKSVTGGTQDSGVIVGNPRFSDAENGDYSLKHNSPCRDRGLLLDWMSADAVDLLGNPRVVRDGRPLAEDPAALPDIGCYECMLPQIGSMLLVF